MTDVAHRTHEYRSTACYHELHLQCRLTCKWCETPCSCDCHGGEDDE